MRCQPRKRTYIIHKNKGALDYAIADFESVRDKGACEFIIFKSSLWFDARSSSTIKKLKSKSGKNFEVHLGCVAAASLSINLKIFDYLLFYTAQTFSFFGLGGFFFKQVDRLVVGYSYPSLSKFPKNLSNNLIFFEWSKFSKFQHSIIRSLFMNSGPVTFFPDAIFTERMLIDADTRCLFSEHEVSLWLPTEIAYLRFGQDYPELKQSAHIRRLKSPGKKCAKTLNNNHKIEKFCVLYFAQKPQLVEDTLSKASKYEAISFDEHSENLFYVHGALRDSFGDAFQLFVRRHPNLEYKKVHDNWDMHLRELGVIFHDDSKNVIWDSLTDIDLVVSEFTSAIFLPSKNIKKVQLVGESIKSFAAKDSKAFKEYATFDRNVEFIPASDFCTWITTNIAWK